MSTSITVNAIAPGPFESKMTQWMLENFQSQIEANYPLGRIGTPADMAGITIYLASPAASYIAPEEDALKTEVSNSE